jgi:hypothetical protein
MKLDQQIHVAIFFCLAPHGRPEERERLDAQPLKVRLAPTQDLKDLFSPTPILTHLYLLSYRQASDTSTLVSDCNIP